MNDKGTSFPYFGAIESSNTWQRLQNKTHRNYRRAIKKAKIKRRSP